MKTINQQAEGGRRVNENDLGEILAQELERIKDCGGGLTSQRLKGVPESVGLNYAGGRVIGMSSNREGKDGNQE